MIYGLRRKIKIWFRHINIDIVKSKSFEWLFGALNIVK